MKVGSYRVVEKQCCVGPARKALRCPGGSLAWRVAVCAWRSEVGDARLYGKLDLRASGASSSFLSLSKRKSQVRSRNARTIIAEVHCPPAILLWNASARVLRIGCPSILQEQYCKQNRVAPVGGNEHTPVPPSEINDGPECSKLLKEVAPTSGQYTTIQAGASRCRQRPVCVCVNFCACDDVQATLVGTQRLVQNAALFVPLWVNFSRGCSVKPCRVEAAVPAAVCDDDRVAGERRWQGHRVS